MTDIMEIEAALEPLVREGFQLCAYVIHFALDGVAGRFWQGTFENVGDQI